jgi:hypothetical protein
MKRTLILLSFTLLCKSIFAQTIILPGDKKINPNLIHQGNFSMVYYHSDVTQVTDLGTYDVDVQIKEGKFNLNTFRKTKYYEEKNIIIADANSFKALHRTTNILDDGKTSEFVIGNGEFTNTKTGKKTNYDTKLTEQYFDYHIYPYVLSALPLKLGNENYVIPTISVDDKNSVTTDEVIVLETKSDQFTSQLTGQHMCWKVTVYHKNTKKYLNYYIDKNNRRIRKIEHLFKGKILGFLDKEKDINLFKTSFDEQAIRKMMNDGESIITGEAFARDDRSGKDNKLIKIDILNVNKKQFAPKGTKVLLMPYTEYYKEWFELNKNQAKVKGAKPIPLPKEAASQVKISEIYDDKGHFEFSNLMNGEYLLFTSFNYEDFFSKREVTGKADVYVNGSYQGTEVYTDMFGYTQQGNANFYKFVTIQKNGEKIDVKLKR